MFFGKELGRSLKRHGKKTAIALLVSAVLGAFLCQFAGSVEGYRQRLVELSEKAELRVTFVNTSGTREIGLKIYDDKLQALEESGMLQAGLYVANCWFSDGTEDDRPNPLNPKRLTQDIVAYTNASPLGGAEAVNWFEGYDASVLASDQAVCLLPQERFDRLGYQPGDTVHIQFITGGSNGKSVFPGQEMDMAIAGTFASEDAALSGFGMVCPYRTMRRGLKESKLNIWPTQAYLTIPDSEDLNAVKALLQELEIDPLDNTLRALSTWAEYGNTAIINDGVYIGTAEPTQRTLDLLRSLYPAVFAAVALIALLASYLLIQSRREEIALQRSLGVGRGRIFGLFIGESACLCVLGAALGCLFSVCVAGTPLAALALPLLGYVGSYLLGSAIAVLLTLRTGVLAVLAAAPA